MPSRSMHASNTSLFTSAAASFPIDPSGPGAPVGEAEHLGADPQLGDPVASHGVAGAAGPDLEEAVDGALAAPATLPADRHPFVHEGGHRHPPAVSLGAQSLVVGDADVGEVDLVELGLSGHLKEGSHLDA